MKLHKGDCKQWVCLGHWEYFRVLTGCKKYVLTFRMGGTGGTLFSRSLTAQAILVENVLFCQWLWQNHFRLVVKKESRRTENELVSSGCVSCRGKKQRPGNNCVFSRLVLICRGEIRLRPEREENNETDVLVLAGKHPSPIVSCVVQGLSFRILFGGVWNFAHAKPVLHIYAGRIHKVRPHSSDLIDGSKCIRPGIICFSYNFGKCSFESSIGSSAKLPFCVVAVVRWEALPEWYFLDSYHSDNWAAFSFVPKRGAHTAYSSYTVQAKPETIYSAEADSKAFTYSCSSGA